MTRLLSSARCRILMVDVWMRVVVRVVVVFPFEFGLREPIRSGCRRPCFQTFHFVEQGLRGD